MGQALFVNSFPLSLAVRLNFLLLPAELGAGWKFPASGPTGRPWGPEYPAQPNRVRLHSLFMAQGGMSPHRNNFGSYGWDKRHGERLDFMPGFDPLLTVRPRHVSLRHSNCYSASRNLI